MHCYSDFNLRVNNKTKKNKEKYSFNFLIMKRVILVFLFFFIITQSCRKSDYYIDDESIISDNGGGTGTITWTADKKYLINGFVFVNDGQVLTIEPGTIIQGKTGQGIQASALIVARGGKIIAEGRPDQPIVFTVEGDDLKGSVPMETSGLWGGLIILGNATVNNQSGEAYIEGIPISEPRGIYGGNYDDDNSGILKYVSIRHGGTNIGEGNEINGLTLGGVGRKTSIEFVEVISNADDGIEFFGGTVNCSKLAVAFCGDDAFDFDEGYSGKCQFLLGISDPAKGDLLAEHSGASLPASGKPFSHPEISNATYVGRTTNPGNYLIHFDENSGGTYKNSIFLNYASGVGIEYESNGGSFEMWKNGDLEMEKNIFYNNQDMTSDTILRLFPFNGSLSAEQEVLNLYFLQAGNEIKNPGFTLEDFNYQLLPSNTIFLNMAENNSTWFEKVTYKGAFGSRNWLEGWSNIWEEGIVR